MYGRGVDNAQSLRAGEYVPTESKLLKRLSWGGRIKQDVRSVSTEKASLGTNGSTLGFSTRLMYRNVTYLGKGYPGFSDGDRRKAHFPALSTIRSGDGHRQGFTKGINNVT